MTWGRLDDRANGHAKLLALTDPGWRLWGAGLIYCNANLTNGQIPEYAIATFGVRKRPLRAVIDELCSVLIPGKGPLWHRPGEGQAAGKPGYQVHDYLVWNPTAEKVIAGRAKSKARVDRFRERLAASQSDAAESGVTPLLEVLHDSLQHQLPNANTARSEMRAERTSTTTTTEDQNQDQDQRRAPRAAKCEPIENFAFLELLANQVLNDVNAGLVKFTNFKETLKTRAAREGVRYDGDRWRKAMDSAIAARSKTRRRA